MKLHYLSALLLFLILFVHHCYGQNFSSSINSSSNEVSYSASNGNNLATVVDNNSSSNTGISGVIRNTTNNLLQRLEGPRDRVVEFIKPAVKSEFSRNVTKVLNSIWSRVQESNSSLIQSPLFKNAIVIPVNNTLNQLKKITAPENAELDDESNLEVINLNKPEDEAQFREYLQSSSNSKEEAIVNPRVIFLVRNDDQQTAASEENSETEKHDEVNNNNSNREAIDGELNPTKSRRSSRFMDNHYTIVSPTRVNHLFDNVQRHGMQECMAQALCEANCRPQLYNESRTGLFKRVFDRVESFGSNHQDYDYYVDARRFGQQYNDRGMSNCDVCRLRYSCQHEREYIMDRLYGMANFY